MDRTSGRTLGCYVEFQSERDAREVLRRIRKVSDSGFGPRMGRSTIDITLSSQNALLKAVFPKAWGVEWVNGWPRAGSSRDQGSSIRFDGFLSNEELTFLVRFANQAERVSYILDCVSLKGKSHKNYSPVPQEGSFSGLMNPS